MKKNLRKNRKINNSKAGIAQPPVDRTCRSTEGDEMNEIFRRSLNIIKNLNNNGRRLCGNSIRNMEKMEEIK